MSTGPTYVAFDLETTGLSPKRDRIIEVGAVRFDSGGRVMAELDLVVNPGMPVPLPIQRLVGLSDADLREAPSPAEAVAQLAEFCEGFPLVAHGGMFDLAFCSAVLPEAFRDRVLYDTLELARILLPLARSHSLPLLSTALGITHERPHRAHSDADATRLLLVHLLSVAAELPQPTLDAMRAVASEIPNPLASFFTQSVAGPGSAGIPAQRGACSSPRTLRLATDLGGAGSLDTAAAAYLGPAGPLAQSNPRYEYRDAQVQMATAVAQTMERRGRLLVEAGTGVGKSLAYLVPLALNAAREQSRAVVATHTITLQEQLVEQDLPLLDQASATVPSVEVRYAMLKGRQHYLSLRRWERFVAGSGGRGAGADLDTIRFTLKVLSWLVVTETGDRAELRLTSDEEALWRRVESDPSDCLGTACANWNTARCFMVAARRAADQALLVITNHALLLSDAETQGRVMAPFDALVVDEAHHLEASATQQWGIRLRATDLSLILDRLAPTSDARCQAVIDSCGEAATRLFGETKGFLTEQLGGDQPGNGVVGLDPDLREGSRATSLLRAARHAIAALRTGAAALEEARDQEAAQGLLPGPSRFGDELGAASAALLDAARSIERVLCAPDPGEVTWLELRAEQAELRSAPVSVAEALEEGVYGRVDATVLTSATLTVSGSFDFVRHRTGIGGRAEELTLDSPFDYFAQSICIVPAEIPPYDDPAYESALAALLADVAVRLGGRTLALFTGYGPLQRVHRQVLSRLNNQSIAVLGQGMDGTRRQILRSFTDDPRTLLMGTNSLWEGIDLPGDLLRCVVIAKLPFAVPTDPLVRARSAQLSDPFSQYVLPMAVLRLRQGFGRLIRSSSDRGAVVLCDSRLRTREYGARFFETLPPAEVTECALADVGRRAHDFVEQR